MSAMCHAAPLTRTGHSQHSDRDEVGACFPLLLHFWTTVAKMLHTQEPTYAFQKPMELSLRSYRLLPPSHRNI